ncbi:MAG: cytochrome-c peroxidase, partial [Verrucomicrobiota bacterium]
VDIANSLAAYQAVAFRADESPFDLYLRGHNVLHPAEERGMDLFFGAANCASCHSGKFLTDHSFHAIAMPQIGPGKGDGHGGNDDFGRERVTKLTSDRYKFRTPGLRNVALTGPWGHAGQFATLEATIAHHADAVASLRSYNTNQAVLPNRSDLNNIDFLVHRHGSSRIALEKKNQLPARSLSRSDIADLVAFLESLTDRYSIDLEGEIPRSVPSGLSIDR